MKARWISERYFSKKKWWHPYIHGEFRTHPLPMHVHHVFGFEMHVSYSKQVGGFKLSLCRKYPCISLSFKWPTMSLGSKYMSYLKQVGGFELCLCHKYPCIPLSFKWPKIILNSSCQFQTQYSSLPSLLQVHITSLFQFQFVHHLKHWTLDFPSFETIYSLPKIDLEKCSKFYLKVKIRPSTRF